MTITIKPTGNFVNCNGTHCRVWEGRTDQGVPCLVYVPRIRVSHDVDSAAFDRELIATLPPTEEMP